MNGGDFLKHRRKRYRSNKSIFGAFVLAVVVILFIVALIRLEKAVRPAAELQAEQISRNTANRIISETVSRYINENECSYSNFSAILYDSSGRVASVEALTQNINRVQSELSAEINDRLVNSKTATAEIPLGTLSGSYLLAGKGPKVKVKICPVGTADVKLKGTFDSAGINQTMHRIYAEISADISSSAAIYNFETETEFEYLIAETVIVGDVPDYTVKAWSESFRE